MGKRASSASSASSGGSAKKGKSDEELVEMFRVAASVNGKSLEDVLRFFSASQGTGSTTTGSTGSSAGAASSGEEAPLPLQLLAVAYVFMLFGLGLFFAGGGTLYLEAYAL